MVEEDLAINKFAPCMNCLLDNMLVFLNIYLFREFRNLYQQSGLVVTVMDGLTIHISTVRHLAAAGGTGTTRVITGRHT